MYRILRILILLLEVAIRSDIIGRSGPMEFPVGHAGNNFYFLGPFLAEIIKFYISKAGPASKDLLKLYALPQ